MRDRLAAVGARLAPHRRPLGIGAAIVVVVVIAAVVAVVALRGAGEEPNMHGYDDTVVSISDIPARAFIGWEQVEPGPRPSPATTPDGMSVADKPDCVPGGVKQRAAENLVLSGDMWGSSKFVNPGFASTMTVAVSNSPNTDVTALDKWLNDCADITADVDNDSGAPGQQHVTLSSLPIEPAFYRLDLARVYAQTVTDADDHTITRLVGYGQSKGLTLQVVYTFPGAVTDESIQQLDVVWRAQAAKLVGMQEAGKA
ncbi:MAG: hypothetical protein L0H59_03565 [Tomitella sp.]|nr:hypothetical protein [Tomitella sp.]